MNILPQMAQRIRTLATLAKRRVTAESAPRTTLAHVSESMPPTNAV